MYVCICNGINERAVRSAICEHGARCTGSVYRSLGVRPSCGKCSVVIKDMLMEHRVHSDPAHSAAE